jgi:hypothetical protein
MRRHIGLAVLFLLAVLLAGCSKNPERPDTHSLSGHVKLTGELRGEAGEPLGARVIRDADSIQVDLVKDGALHASSRTEDGGYRFLGLGAGTYRVIARVTGTIADTTGMISLSGADVAIADTLELGHSGDLTATPNPIVVGAEIRFGIPSAGVVNLSIVTQGGSTIATLAGQSMEAGQHIVTWNGHDSQDQPVVAGVYWVLFRQGDDYRADLIFK